MTSTVLLLPSESSSSMDPSSSAERNDAGVDIKEDIGKLMEVRTPWPAALEMMGSNYNLMGPQL